MYVFLVTLHNLLSWYYWSVYVDNLNLLSIRSMQTDSDLVIAQDSYKGNKVHSLHNLIGQILYMSTLYLGYKSK